MRYSCFILFCFFADPVPAQSQDYIPGQSPYECYICRKDVVMYNRTGHNVDTLLYGSRICWNFKKNDSLVFKDCGPGGQPWRANIENLQLTYPLAVWHCRGRPVPCKTHLDTTYRVDLVLKDQHDGKWQLIAVPKK